MRVEADSIDINIFMVGTFSCDKILVIKNLSFNSLNRDVKKIINFE